MNHLRKTFLWILLLPYALGFLGIASNDLVTFVNAGKFPVRLNPSGEAKLTPDEDGMIDLVHCRMTPETHLNWLGDVIDRGNNLESIGDILIEESDSLLPYCWGMWIGIILYRRERDFDGDSKHKLQTVQSTVSRPSAMPVRLFPN